MQFMALTAKTMDALEKKKERYLKEGWNKSTPEMKIFENGEYWYYVCVFRNGKPESRYTAKEIAEAITWHNAVCAKMVERLVNGEVDYVCSQCPIGLPCFFSTKEGMQNILLKWEEMRAHEID